MGNAVARFKVVTIARYTPVKKELPINPVVIVADKKI